MADITQLLQSLITGVGVGLIYGLVGIGFCVIYNASGIVNFAQGVFVMLGGMICHALLTRLGLPLVLAAVLAVPIVAGIGMLIETLVVRPMWNRGATMFAIILATLATQIMIERITILTLGDQPRSFPEFTPGGPLKLGDIAVGYQLFWILGCGALMVGLLWLFFTRTRTGRALRACSQNREAAALLGIPVGRMLLVSFALSAALGAVAGILVTPTQVTAFNIGTPFGVNGFIAAIIGGFGSAAGALAGGVLLGVLQAAAIVLFGAGFKNVAALSTLLVVLLLFPSGIFAGFKGFKRA
ncbi:branched-chain amino acid ABC transporter permease [Alsobacter metallidurans]|uniref:Branched-chain amino acid ABC transporter permease n=1 Tax=Alsobacter metallidurans TaxID=340221 RepID=A0A917I5K0_9HYPH|nr:branched-chain amino acid ABC transporter permease [Alsobacter metallidurans]GGH12705.1 branched-chain amino acid ABC transporter permease [Alsobacter metallidurans]